MAKPRLSACARVSDLAAIQPDQCHIATDKIGLLVRLGLDVARAVALSVRMLVQVGICRDGNKSIAWLVHKAVEIEL